MKTIIAGSRTFYDLDKFNEELKHYLENGAIITEVVSGGASGADTLGEIFARKYEIPVKVFPAEWHTHGKAAGPIRNRAMAEYADALVAFWDWQSAGTKNMINEMRKRDKHVYVVEI